MSTTTPKPPTADYWLGLFTPALAAGALLLVSPIIILRAWVMSTLWGWYVVPAFGAEPLRVVFAFGLCLMFAFARGAGRKSDTTLGQSIVQGGAFSMFALLVGWAGSFFV